MSTLPDAEIPFKEKEQLPTSSNGVVVVFQN
jgi:hypothetical protein